MNNYKQLRHRQVNSINISASSNEHMQNFYFPCHKCLLYCESQIRRLLKKIINEIFLCNNNYISLDIISLQYTYNKFDKKNKFTYIYDNLD